MSMENLVRIEPGLALGVKLAYTTPGSIPNCRLWFVLFANKAPLIKEKTTAFLQLSVACPSSPRNTLPCRLLSELPLKLRLSWNRLRRSGVGLAADTGGIEVVAEFCGPSLKMRSAAVGSFRGDNLRRRYR